MRRFRGVGKLDELGEEARLAVAVCDGGEKVAVDGSLTL